MRTSTADSEVLQITFDVLHSSLSEDSAQVVRLVRNPRIQEMYSRLQ